MTPIINPMYFYYLYIYTNFHSALAAIVALLLIWIITVAAIAGVGILCTAAGEIDKEKLLSVISAALIRHPKIVISITAALLMLHTLLPSPDTIHKMYIANNVTCERMEHLKEIGIDIKNELKSDILDIIDEVTAERE